ncbi:hypothetical protein BN136_3334 [Cronobacter universalis NCTC 9529]|nr:hypothetical protein BN136_3334 [Cronobacter universalis NCTC 9529]
MDSLRHIANLIHLLQQRRFHRVILRRQPVDHIAQLHHRLQNAALEDKPEHKEKQQRRQPNHDFRERAQPQRSVGRRLNRRAGALVQQASKMRKLKIHSIELALIVDAKQQLQGAGVIAARHRIHRLLLFIFQPMGHRHALAQML